MALTDFIFFWYFLYIYILQTDFIRRKILGRQKKIVTLTKKIIHGVQCRQKNPAYTVVCQEINTVTRGLGKKIITQTISPTLLHHLVCCDFLKKNSAFINKWGKSLLVSHNEKQKKELNTTFCSAPSQKQLSVFHLKSISCPPQTVHIQSEV